MPPFRQRAGPAVAFVAGLAFWTVESWFTALFPFFNFAVTAQFLIFADALMADLTLGTKRKTRLAAFFPKIR